ncbi:MAG: hypothetical protein Kow0065_17470 [Methylomicrobium sp.]
MSQQLTRAETRVNPEHNNGALLLGAGLAVASMIVVPALAMRLGLGASLTGALRIALMKASNRAANGAFRSSSKAATSS